MEKPYIICHMMSSVDGRIDCAMTEQLKGVEDYYETLAKLNVDTTVSGKRTAELEMTLSGKYVSKNLEIYGKEGFSKKVDAKGYEVVVDSKGELLWEKENGDEKPLLIITSEQVTKEYLNYLDEQNISWIVCGKNTTDLVKASKTLYEEFHVERMAVVGGALINGAFLKAGLLDEVSILIGAGIDGRKGMPGVFDGFDIDQPISSLSLKDVETFKSGAVWIRYKTVE